MVRSPNAALRSEQLPRDDLNDALGVDHGPFRLTEEKNHVVIVRCPDASGFGEQVLHAIVQAHGKRSERRSFSETLDVFDFRRWKFTPFIRRRYLKKHPTH